MLCINPGMDIATLRICALCSIGPSQIIYNVYTYIIKVAKIFCKTRTPKFFIDLLNLCLLFIRFEHLSLNWIQKSQIQLNLPTATLCLQFLLCKRKFVLLLFTKNFQNSDLVLGNRLKKHLILWSLCHSVFQTASINQLYYLLIIN